jgi:AcrR family transcriptional regulator
VTKAAVPAPTVQVGSSTWSQREAELLTVTLQLLQEHGYAGLTVDAVAATARASKATVYRRWPSKAELVLAAVVEGFRQVGDIPDTGTLRGDLIQIGEVIRVQTLKQASTIAAIFFEQSHSRELRRALGHEFVDKQQLWIHEIVLRAVDRGELGANALTDDLWDVLPGYLVFRCVFPIAGGPPDPDIVRRLVDEVILPRFTHRSTCVACQADGTTLLP